MFKLLLVFFTLLTFIPRVFWANLALVSADQSGRDFVAGEYITNIPKRKRKTYNNKLSIQSICRKLQISSIIPQKTNGFKNLMVYVSPIRSFDNKLNYVPINGNGLSIKVQIDNSLALGWKPEDIILVTNFEYEYGPVKAIVLPNLDFFETIPQNSKINALTAMFENGLIKNDQLYWFHDIDGFQLHPISVKELHIKHADMALPDHSPGLNGRWSAFSIFFKKSAGDIFYKIKERMYKEQITEELALQRITDEDPRILKRIKRLDKTYKYHPNNTSECYKNATRPIRLVHLHPLEGIPKLDDNTNKPFLPDRLIKIFGNHGIEVG